MTITECHYGNTVVNFSDGSKVVIPKAKDGAAGKDGKSITVQSTEKTPEDDTKVTFSDGTSVTIAKGDTGATGAAGRPAAPVAPVSPFAIVTDVPSENVTFVSSSGVFSVLWTVIDLPSFPAAPSLAFGMTTFEPSEKLTTVLP